MEIERLNNIEDIIALQKKYYDENGILPLNVSNWTVSTDFRKQMEFVFQHDVTNSPIDYLYSYNISIEHKENIMKKLGIYTPIPYTSFIALSHSPLSLSICSITSLTAPEPPLTELT